MFKYRREEGFEFIEKISLIIHWSELNYFKPVFQKVFKILNWRAFSVLITRFFFSKTGFQSEQSGASQNKLELNLS